MTELLNLSFLLLLVVLDAKRMKKKLSNGINVLLKEAISLPIILLVIVDPMVSEDLSMNEKRSIGTSSVRNKIMLLLNYPSVIVTEQVQVLKRMKRKLSSGSSVVQKMAMHWP